MISDTDHCPVSVIVQSKRGGGGGGGGGALGKSLDHFTFRGRARGRKVHRPLSISLGRGHDPLTPLATSLERMRVMQDTQLVGYEGNVGYRGVDAQLVGLERMRVMQVIEEWMLSW